MRRSGIYRIELGNGNFYIGSAVDLAERQRGHRSTLNRGKHRNIRVQSCWDKYGVFEFRVLEECKIQQLLLREQIFIDKHFGNPKNVNIAPTAGSSFGVIRSVETCANMSAANKGRKHSAEARAKISAANRRRVHSAETRSKISVANKGRVMPPCSAETRAKISAAGKGRIVSAETRAKMSASQKGKGKVHSAETRFNMSVSSQKRWAKFKMEKLAMEEMDYGKKCS